MESMSIRHWPNGAVHCYFLSGEKEVSKIMKIGFVSLYAPGPLQSNERGRSPAAVAQS